MASPLPDGWPLNCTRDACLPEVVLEPAFAFCADACYTVSASAVDKLPKLLAAVVLIGFSGMFSGLTLGLLSLTIEGLDIVINGGSSLEALWAERIKPMRSQGNLLLCTLLLGNTLVNAMISILLADLTSGVVGGLIATGLIVIFGEIIPQSVCSRHGLRIGAASAFLVKPLMVVLLPITWPIAKVLDLVLGREMGTQYNRQQLDKLLEMQVTDHALTTDDQRLLSSALHFSAKVVEEIMTPLKDVFAISVTDNLDFDDLKSIYVSGYTRIPVFHNRRDTIVGIVYTKDLILVDPNDEIPVASILPFCSRAINAAPKGTTLEKLLADMQASRSHLYFVTDAVGPCRKKLPRVERVIGIVTMEDLIEELINIEIIDESDTITDNREKKKVNTRSQRRIEFFEMLQKRELLITDRMLSDNSHIGGERPTADEVRALTSFLTNNVANFRPPNMSYPLLRKLLQRCSIASVTPEQLATGRYVYVRGVPASFCCLVLHGRLQIRAGNEGFTTEIGAWTVLATQALTDVDYIPDFTARVEVAARILIITRADVHAVIGVNSSPVPNHLRDTVGGSAMPAACIATTAAGDEHHATTRYRTHSADAPAPASASMMYNNIAQQAAAGSSPSDGTPPGVRARNIAQQAAAGSPPRAMLPTSLLDASAAAPPQPQPPLDGAVVMNVTPPKPSPVHATGSDMWRRDDRSSPPSHRPTDRSSRRALSN